MLYRRGKPTSLPRTLRKQCTQTARDETTQREFTRLISSAICFIINDLAAVTDGKIGAYNRTFSSETAAADMRETQKYSPAFAVIFPAQQTHHM